MKRAEFGGWPRAAAGGAFCAVAATLLIAAPAQCQQPALKPQLSGLDFLVGRWTTPKRGQVAETGGTSLGTSNFTPEVGGAVLLRKDHVNLFDKAGAAAGDFDILMMIYPEAGTVHADYSDGTHVIHYTSASILPGRQVIFTSSPSSAAPTFRLTYALAGPGLLRIDFAMAGPNESEFHSIATGEARKSD